MGLFDFFKKIVNDGFDDKDNAYLNFKNSKKCMIKFKLSNSEMIVFGFRYIWGLTSYRGFFRDVIKKDMNKFNKLMDEIKKKAKKGCYYDEIFIRFYSDYDLYIDIPLNVFSMKKSLSASERNKKLWHKNNLIRLMNYSSVFKKEIIENN